MQILEEMSTLLQQGRAKKVVELVKQALAEGIAPQTIMEECLLSGMTLGTAVFVYEGYNGKHGRHDCVCGIVEAFRRMDAENTVTDNTAAYGSGRRYDNHTEGIHLLFDCSQRAGHPEGTDADAFYNKNE